MSGRRRRVALAAQELLVGDLNLSLGALGRVAGSSPHHPSRVPRTRSSLLVSAVAVA